MREIFYDGLRTLNNIKSNIKNGMKPMTNVEKNWLSEINALNVDVRWMNVILEVFVDDDVMIQLP